MTTPAFVIVGGGQSGAWAARTLRSEGYEGRIVLVSEELHAPYERPPLSKEILLGTGAVADLTIISHDELVDLGVEVFAGLRATRLDCETHTVTLSNGHVIVYDKLTLCTGGRARRLDLPGIDASRVHTLRTLDDALSLKKALEDNPGHVLIIGGGWIGLEVAASARALGCAVTVLEAADRLCARSVTPEVSESLLELHSAQGVSVRLATSVTQGITGPHGFTVTLSDGSTLDSQHMVQAAGLIANDELAAEAGLSCSNGVLVDPQCRTSDSDIFAAGDVAVLDTSLPGVRMRLESWHNAQDQGVAVARSMLGLPVEYRPVPMVWSQQFEHFIQISGHPQAGQGDVITRPAGTGRLHFYQDETGRVIGAIGFNAGRDFRFARQLVERNVYVPTDALADEARSLKSLLDTANR